MKQNKLIISLAVMVIIALIAFMTYDFFGGFDHKDKNVYEYKLDDFNAVDPALVEYEETDQIIPQIDNLRCIAIDVNDKVYLSGKDKILIYSNDFSLIKEIKTDVDALSISLDEEGDVFLGARDHIEVWSAEGSLKESWEVKNEKVVITSIAIADSSVFVADAGNKIIYHYDLNGNFKNEIGRKDSAKGIQGFVIPSPYFDLAIGRDNELWAVNSGRHQLEAYDAEGNQRSSWKKTSMGIDGFSGCCNPSHIVMLNDGSFVTSEKGIVRVKIHRPSGELKSVVAIPDQFDKGTKGIDLAVDSKSRIYVLDPKRKLIRIFQKIEER